MNKKALLQEGDIIISDHQEKGKGQRGNEWQSEPGKNLTLSVLLKPKMLDISRHFFLNIMTSLGILRCLEKYVNSSLRIKWPNDIYLNNRKMGGILIENSIFSTTIESSVIGIGININQERFSRDFQATSLKIECGIEQNLNDILNNLIASLDREYQKLRDHEFSRLEKDYVKNLYWINEKHIFNSEEGSFEGVIRGIDPDGKLLVEIDGSEKRFDFKEISFVR